jgi:hypothetical protein
MNVRVQGGEALTCSGWAKVLSVTTKKSIVTAVRVFNKSANAIYVLIFDLEAAPSNATTGLVGIIRVDGDSYGGEQWGDSGAPFSNGCYLYASQVATALTAIGSADALLTAVYTQQRT